MVQLEPSDEGCDFWETYSPGNTDIATGTWAASGVFDEYCTPAWLPTRVTVTQLFGPDSSWSTDCTAQGIRTVTEVYTCDSVTITIVEEYWFCSNDICGAEACSYCQEYQRTEEVFTLTYNRPGASDVECDQCKAALFA